MVFKVYFLPLLIFFYGSLYIFVLHIGGNQVRRENEE
jgi:hypothetical protein